MAKNINKVVEATGKNNVSFNTKLMKVGVKYSFQWPDGEQAAVEKTKDGGLILYEVARPVCSKCGSVLKIDWSYQEIECPKCGEFKD
jgi:tRNA(Ile2) C34 agmatinyltransferase TiaS